MHHVMSRWGDVGSFLRDAGVRKITPLISHRCHRLYTKIEANIWVTIMSAFTKTNIKKVVKSITKRTLMFHVNF